MVDIEDRPDLQGRFNEVSKAVGICWTTIAVLCQVSVFKNVTVPTWIALIAFHLMNSIAIVANSGSLDLDGAISVMMLLLSVYGYRTSDVVAINTKKD